MDHIESYEQALHLTRSDNSTALACERLTIYGHFQSAKAIYKVASILAQCLRVEDLRLQCNWPREDWAQDACRNALSLPELRRVHVGWNGKAVSNFFRHAGNIGCTWSSPKLQHVQFGSDFSNVEEDLQYTGAQLVWTESGHQILPKGLKSLYVVNIVSKLLSDSFARFITPLPRSIVRLCFFQVGYVAPIQLTAAILELRETLEWLEVVTCPLTADHDGMLDDVLSQLPRLKVCVSVLLPKSRAQNQSLVLGSFSRYAFPLSPAKFASLPPIMALLVSAGEDVPNDPLAWVMSLWTPSLDYADISFDSADDVFEANVQRAMHLSSTKPFGQWRNDPRLRHLGLNEAL